MVNILKTISCQFTGQVIVKFVFKCHRQLRYSQEWGYKAQNMRFSLIYDKLLPIIDFHVVAWQPNFKMLKTSYGKVIAI